MIGAAGGGYLFYRGFRMLQRKRLILNTPTSKIRSASIGLVEISGLAVGPYTITAPLTNVPCYYYQTIAWQMEQSGKSKKWKKVAEESLHVSFFLDDNTARVLVDPQGAEMDIHCDFHEEFNGSFFSSQPDLPANVSSFLARHGVSVDDKIKVDEFCIKPKNALFILGTLAQNHGVQVSATPVAGLRAPGLADPIITVTTRDTITYTSGRKTSDNVSQEIVRLSNTQPSAGTADMTQQGRIAAAMMKAGITNPAAWAAAGVTHGGTVAASASSNGSTAATGVAPEGFDLHPPTVLMKGTHNPAFFISWQSQKQIVNSLGWKSAAMIWGGPALTLLCAYTIAAHFGWL